MLCEFSSILWLVCNCKTPGDLIEIDIPASTINAKISDQEFEKRKAEYKAPDFGAKSGWLARYQRNVTSADKGAVME